MFWDIIQIELMSLWGTQNLRPLGLACRMKTPGEAHSSTELHDTFV